MPDSAHIFFSRLFTESRDALRRYVRRLVRSDDSADEIVQEAFLRTYENRESVQTARAFLFSTARNLATDRGRRDRTAPQDVLDEFGDSQLMGVGSTIDDQLLVEESSRILKEAIERLPPQRQAALTLRLFHGRSAKEIGEILGISWTTVKKHIELGTYSVRKHVLERYEGGRDGR